MSFKIIILTFLLASCGVKAPPKPKNNNFPSFVEKHKKVLRPGMSKTITTEDEEDNTKKSE